MEKKLAPLKEITTAPTPLVRNSERIFKNVYLVSLLSNYFSSHNWDSWSYMIDILFPISEKLKSPWKKWTQLWRWWKEGGQNNKQWSICKSLIHFKKIIRKNMSCLLLLKARCSFDVNFHDWNLKPSLILHNNIV